MVLNWGLIGCGDIVNKRVGAALRDLDNCNLVAVSRARGNLAEGCAREFGASRWYDDWHELLEDRDVQAVYVATPPYLHAEQTIAAAKKGKHVICEKPMALSTEDCRRMIDACSENNVSLSIAYYRRFYPVIKRVKEVIDEGIIGKPIIAQINAFEYFDIKSGDERDWLIEGSKAGGGPMMDFGCHRIELLLSLFGNAEEVKGKSGNVYFEREVEDTAIGVIGFSGGTMGIVSVTTAAEEPMDSLDMYGSKGSIHIPVVNKGELIIRSMDEVMHESYPPHENLHLPYIEAVTDAILSRKKVPVDGETGLEVNRIIEEIYS